MNITFVTPAMGYGGAERVTSILSNKWTEMGHNVSIVMTGKKKECVYSLNDRVKLRCMGGMEGKPVIAHINHVKELKREILSLNSDVVISFFKGPGAYAAYALKNTKIPFIYSERNDPNRPDQTLKDKVFKRIVEKKANGIVFQTIGAKMCNKKYIQKKSEVILNPFNTEGLPVYDFEKRKKEIVTVGRLHIQKNQKLLIDAFKLIADDFPEYTLKLYGDGTLKDTLQKQIDDCNLKDRVILMGSHKDVLNKICSASLFVLSSDFEGLPNALIEAMCIGIPSVSTDCSPGGARELIKNGKNGFIVPCNDVNALSNAMKKVLSNEKLAETFSVNGKNISKSMDCDEISKSWIEFIEKYR